MPSKPQRQKRIVAAEISAIGAHVPIEMLRVSKDVFERIRRLFV